MKEESVFNFLMSTGTRDFFGEYKHQGYLSKGEGSVWQTSLY